MKIYDELKARGLIAQVTDEELISNLINEGKATFYIGFDPTADSLHVGHFMALCLMKRLQMAGNKPIALIGGGTGYIGDPSGRTDMRSMMTPEQIQHNCDCFKEQMSKFIDFSEGKAMMVNNADWLLDLNYIELLREVAPAGYAVYIKICDFHQIDPKVPFCIPLSGSILIFLYHSPQAMSPAANSLSENYAFSCKAFLLQKIPKKSLCNKKTPALSVSSERAGVNPAVPPFFTDDSHHLSQ